MLGAIVVRYCVTKMRIVARQREFFVVVVCFHALIDVEESFVIVWFRFPTGNFNQLIEVLLITSAAWLGVATGLEEEASYFQRHTDFKIGYWILSIASLSTVDYINSLTMFQLLPIQLSIVDAEKKVDITKSYSLISRCVLSEIAFCFFLFNLLYLEDSLVGNTRSPASISDNDPAACRQHKTIYDQYYIALADLSVVQKQNVSPILSELIFAIAKSVIYWQK